MASSITTAERDRDVVRPGTPDSERALSPDTYDLEREGERDDTPPPSSMRPLPIHRRKRPSALLVLAAALGLVSTTPVRAQGPGAAGFGIGAGAGAGADRFNTATRSANGSALDGELTDGGQAAFWIFIAMFPILGLVALVVAVVMVYACPGESRRAKAAAEAAKAEEAEGGGGMGITHDEADAVLEYREEDELAAVPHLGARWDASAPGANGAKGTGGAPGGADMSDGFENVNVVPGPPFPQHAAGPAPGTPAPAPVPVPSPVHLADAQCARHERYA